MGRLELGIGNWELGVGSWEFHVSIPSYDDLTPPIPDIVASDTVPQLARFLRAEPAAHASGGL